MKAVSLILAAEEPLVITDGSAESMGHRTLAHIPGNMLLGALAHAWKRLHPQSPPDASPEFVSLFLADDVEWGHAYPRVGEGPTVPLPLCFQKVKNHGGLPVEGDEDISDCRVFNMFALSEGEKLDACYRRHHPDEADGPVKLSKIGDGFMAPDTCCMPRLSQCWTMHVALSEARTAAESQLFGYSALTPGAVFESYVICKDEAAAQAVLDLVAATPVIHVGHARSAGYGRVRCRAVLAKLPEQQPQGGQADFFLLSDYLPVHSWENPLESLEKELGRALGVPLTLDATHQACAYVSIAAFNGLWRLPRRSRLALKRGSVLRASWSGTARPLPPSLGGWRREGYGRLLCDPVFLSSEMVRPRGVASAAAATDVPPPALTPVVRVLRWRGLSRQAQAAAVDFVSRDDIQRFIETAAGNRRPSQSQRGNIRLLVATRSRSEWKGIFEDMLTKTPGEQWKKAAAYCPFSDYREHLSEIMLRLLDEKEFARLAAPKLRCLGGEPDAREREAFMDRFHRLALLELLNAWEKAFRRNGHDASEEKH